MNLLDNGNNIAFIGSSYVNRQLVALARHLAIAEKGEDVEGVHRVRVACRRLRSAFAFLEGHFEDFKFGRFVKSIKKLMNALGPARDLDVQLIYLQEHLNQHDCVDKIMRPGIHRMTLRWRQKRCAVQAEVITAIARFEKRRVNEEIHLEVERALYGGRIPLTDSAHSGLAGKIHQQISSRAAEFLQLRQYLEQPDDESGHHALRISAKRLRYEMEISSMMMGDCLESGLITVKSVQSLLGELHDCAVWEHDVCRFLEEERQRTLEYYGHCRYFGRIAQGIEFLRHARQKRREELLVASRDIIERLDRERFWETFLLPLKVDD